jgi:hypothetical protein
VTLLAANTRMKHLKWIALSAVLSAVLAGCSLFERSATLLVDNDSDIVVGYVFMSVDGTDWGDNLLGTDTIPAHHDHTFTGIEAGTYYLKAVMKAGSWYRQTYVSFEPGETLRWRLEN